MKRVIYPGSFDPITYGHINLIKRAAKIADEVVVAIAINQQKTPLFSKEKRISLTKEVIKHIDNVSVVSFEGLLIDFALKQNTKVILRGVRNVSDFEFELQLATLNQRLNENIETIFLTPSEKHACVSSRMVREIASFNGCLDSLVPKCVEQALKQKYSKKD
tara:strand:+ start:58 stop:543 length:486 start_codon:yes stop_codon:yes gene_type:complete